MLVGFTKLDHLTTPAMFDYDLGRKVFIDAVKSEQISSFYATPKWQFDKLEQKKITLILWTSKQQPLDMVKIMYALCEFSQIRYEACEVSVENI